jgi:hypothetical protein
MTKVNNQPFKDNDDGYTAFGIFENLPVIDAEGEPLIIAKNTSAYLTYQVKVISGVGVKADEDKSEDSGGGDGDELVIAATYTGCLIQDEEDQQKWCQPDGTLLADVGETPPGYDATLPAWAVVHTACWRGVLLKDGGVSWLGRHSDQKGEWEVGANGFEPTEIMQANILGSAQGALKPIDLDRIQAFTLSQIKRMKCK